MNRLISSSYIPQAIPALKAFLVSLILRPLNRDSTPSFCNIYLNVTMKLANLLGSSCILVFSVSKGAVIVVAMPAAEKALNVLISVEVPVLYFDRVSLF